METDSEVLTYLPKVTQLGMDAVIFDHEFFYFELSIFTNRTPTHHHRQCSLSPYFTYSIYHYDAVKQGDGLALQKRKPRSQEATSLAQSHQLAERVLESCDAPMYQALPGPGRPHSLTMTPTESSTSLRC